MKHNHAILTNPRLHAAAILSGARSETYSRLIEDILEVRYRQCSGKNVEVDVRASLAIRGKYHDWNNDDKSYQDEADLNA